jgi:hypothetical protein
LRRGRRRGIVPVFISIGWFLFSLGISIEGAFGNLGENATAHNLALGLMLGWIPVFILGSIIDRNPMSSDDIRLRLNNLLDRVRKALLDADLRNTYIRDTGRASDDYQWTRALDDDEYFTDSFFSDFAGQGRSRWHYGVAHPILAGIEKAYVAGYGRDWLRDAEAARTAMVLGPETLTGLRWFDWREIWQMLSAVVIVVGTVMGAFVISYWTPTVGLGCRSGGYMIFITMAFASFFIEMLVWWLTPKGREAPPAIFATMGDPLMRMGGTLQRRLTRVQSRDWQTALGGKIDTWMLAWEELPFRSKVDVLVLKPLDVINTSWLIYIVNAQTFGWYVKCHCFASMWGGGGGYIDFESIVAYKAHGISLYWGSGTAVSLVILGLAVMFIIAEWCSQSHLITMDYQAAMRGLRRTRSWKYYTVWLRRAPNAVIEIAVILNSLIVRLITKKKRIRSGRRSLIWAPDVKPGHDTRSLSIRGIPVLDGGNEENADLLNRSMDQKDYIALQTIGVPSPSYARVSPSSSSSYLDINFPYEPARTPRADNT